MKKYLTIIILFFSLAAQSQVNYTPMNAAGYQIKYLKVDSGFALPFRDTALARNVDRPGLMVINPQDTLPYYYNGKIWKPVYVDSTGVIHLIDAKVDSVTVNGNNLFYWVAGLGYGAQLNKLDSIHVSSDSIFTCIAGNCTFQYTTSVGSGTVTSIMAGFGMTGGTITTTGTIAVDTSVFHTTNWNNAAYAPMVHFHSASDIISGTLPVARGGTGMSGIGGVGQVIRVASGGTTLEYYTPPTNLSSFTNDVPFVREQDSGIVYVTPHDISGKVNYTDSTIKYVTPHQLNDTSATAYHTIGQAADSSYFTINKPNGVKDTVRFVGAGGGSGSSVTKSFYKVTTTSASSYTLTADSTYSSEIIIGNSSSNTVAIYLPQISTVKIGKKYTIKRFGANTVQMQQSTSDAGSIIDYGYASGLGMITDKNSVTVVSDGTDWVITDFLKN